eukprot:484641-Pyramimonas_sp.AAC.1
MLQDNPDLLALTSPRKMPTPERDKERCEKSARQTYVGYPPVAPARVKAAQSARDFRMFHPPLGQHFYVGR